MSSYLQALHDIDIISCEESGFILTKSVGNGNPNYSKTQGASPSVDVHIQGNTSACVNNTIV